MNSHFKLIHKHGQQPQRCNRCVMDLRVDPFLKFNDGGVCNHCLRYDKLLPIRTVSGDEAKEKLNKIVSAIKRRGSTAEYDCIVGMSGGLDSTYVVYLAKKLGLRPLAVHVDNGWNTEFAIRNIERAVKALGIDLVTHVLDWREFVDVQRSFLLASTPDGEIPTDHAIVSVVWREAIQRGIKYFLTGMNFATESIHVPHWVYGHYDWKYIRAVHHRYGSVSLRNYPHCNFLYLTLYASGIRGIRSVSPLNYIDYKKAEIVQLLQKELGWQEYGGKHHESIYTRFYQGYLLPKKFGIDKRTGHLSDLINAGQLTREVAITKLQEEPYPTKDQLADITYVCKRLNLSPAEFGNILQAECRTYRDFPNAGWQENIVRGILTTLRKIRMYPQ